MTAWSAQPVIHEVDTWVWLAELGPDLTLGTVPPEAWDALALPGVDAVWLMGVWERSPAGLADRAGNDSCTAAFAGALPDLVPADVVGSPYCIRRYVADARLGGPAGLAAARAELARRGVRLLLDYVPNHVAPDHPWVRERPEVFVHGTRTTWPASPTPSSRSAVRCWPGPGPVLPALAGRGAAGRLQPPDAGRDGRDARDIGDQCDGVRCDMAMLLLTEVFAKTWGDRVGSAPATEFWPEVLGRVRQRHPDMLFVAEADWDLEWALQQQGFDHCYDKRLYDRLAGEDASSVRAHLRADIDYQRRLVRFLENHDEPRAAATLVRSSASAPPRW